MSDWPIDKSILRIHGYISLSDEDSDSSEDDSKSKLDALYEKLQPPPIQVDPTKYRIIEIGEASSYLQSNSNLTSPTEKLTKNQLRRYRRKRRYSVTKNTEKRKTDRFIDWCNSVLQLNIDGFVILEGNDRECDNLSDTSSEEKVDCGGTKLSRGQRRRRNKALWKAVSRSGSKTELSFGDFTSDSSVGENGCTKNNDTAMIKEEKEQVIRDQNTVVSFTEDECSNGDPNMMNEEQVIPVDNTANEVLCPGPSVIGEENNTAQESKTSKVELSKSQKRRRRRMAKKKASQTAATSVEKSKKNAEDSASEKQEQFGGENHIPKTEEKNKERNTSSVGCIEIEINIKKSILKSVAEYENSVYKFILYTRTDPFKLSKPTILFLQQIQEVYGKITVVCDICNLIQTVATTYVEYSKLQMANKIRDTRKLAQFYEEINSIYTKDSHIDMYWGALHSTECVVQTLVMELSRIYTNMVAMAQMCLNPTDLEPLKSITLKTRNIGLEKLSLYEITMDDVKNCILSEKIFQNSSSNLDSTQNTQNYENDSSVFQNMYLNAENHDQNQLQQLVIEDLTLPEHQSGLGESLTLSSITPEEDSQSHLPHMVTETLTQREPNVINDLTRDQISYTYDVHLWRSFRDDYLNLGESHFIAKNTQLENEPRNSELTDDLTRDRKHYYDVQFTKCNAKSWHSFRDNYLNLGESHWVTKNTPLEDRPENTDLLINDLTRDKSHYYDAQFAKCTSQLWRSFRNDYLNLGESHWVTKSTDFVNQPENTDLLVNDRTIDKEHCDDAQFSNNNNHLNLGECHTVTKSTKFDSISWFECPLLWLESCDTKILFGILMFLIVFKKIILPLLYYLVMFVISFIFSCTDAVLSLLLLLYICIIFVIKF